MVIHMLKRTPQLIVTFYTTAEAMATERLCRELGLRGRLIPAPRNISADCGIAWATAPALGEQTIRALEDAKIEYAGRREMMI